ncbi:cysteine-rich repeat secretory protein 38-like [Hibiscus syriacus]|uniref:cysteine-rich repeat secretory protein 38-like n=1 Tax=Hibiscus syriacus TaxID=106335 RepID=UPI0019215EB0|nr:cysteine-rich repeat secretory protein 38-like [Hibiscus syriacus]
MSSSRFVFFIYLIIFICLLKTAVGTNAVYFGCSDSYGADANVISFGCSNYRNASSYKFLDNLNQLIMHLSTHAPPTRFALGAFGETPDRVYGLALCRRDFSEDDCKTCILKTGCFIRKRCPDYGAAIIRYNNCLLRFSNAPFRGRIDNLHEIYESNSDKVSESDSFNEKTKGLPSHCWQF